MHFVQLDVGRLHAHGPTPTAFTLRHRFEAGGADVRLGTERDTCPAYLVPRPG